MTKATIYGWMLGLLWGWMSLNLCAQPPALPELKADGAIVRGKLENGVRYALWPDATFKGCFTISLMRKDSLCFQEKFNAARKSIAIDSVLYRAFTDTREAIVRQPEQSGSDNTVILVVGDFKKDDILARLQHLSVVLPSHQSSWKRADREAWEDKAPALTVRKTDAGHALISYALYSRAIDEKWGATIIPTVAERSWLLLERIAKRRLELALESGNIAYGGIRSRYRAARGVESHDVFSLEVAVEEEQAALAAAHLCRVLEDLRSGQVQENEVEAAAKQYLFARFDRQLRPLSLQARTLRLFYSYLYPCDLASEQEKTRFFTAKKYNATDDKKRFDRFASRMIRVPAEGMALDGGKAFAIGSVASAGGPALNFQDTSAFAGAIRPCKVLRSVAEGTTGGSMIFFENGTRVIYKKKACEGRFYFSYIFDGGTSRLTDPGGVAWTEDIFYAGRINGYSVKDFISLLAAGGIDLQFSASYSAITLSGSCPEKNLSSLLKALIALTGHFRVPEENLDYRVRCAGIPFYQDENERARREVSGLLHPEFAWNPDKGAAGATADNLREVSGLLRESFRSSQNATLFLQGNLAERRLIRKLRRFMDQFPTDGRSLRRNYATMLTVSGTTRVGDIGDDKAMLITSSFNYGTGLDQQLTKEIALTLVQDRLRDHLAGIGVRCRISDQVIFQPVENVELSIRLSGSPMQALRMVNECLRDMGDGNVSEAAFRRAAAELYARIQAQEGSPFYWRDLIFNRLVYGKDYRNQLKPRLDKLSREDVSRFCGQWLTAGRVEYVLE